MAFATQAQKQEYIDDVYTYLTSNSSVDIDTSRTALKAADGTDEDVPYYDDYDLTWDQANVIIMRAGLGDNSPLS